MNPYDLAEDHFWAGSPEETKESHLRHLEATVLGELVQRFQAAAVPEARAHLQGCSKRLLMMQYARGEIADASEGERKPLDSHHLNHLNVCLNAFYLNLLGALDNLAWATAYELQLRSPLDESNREDRFFCTFKSKQFIAALQPKKPALVSHIQASQTWIAEVTRFRDPAAHRLPLSMPPSVMTHEEGERYKELWEQANKALLAGQFEEYDALVMEAEALGRFVPFLNEPRAPDNGIYVVPNLLASDQRRFLDFTHNFLSHLA